MPFSDVLCLGYCTHRHFCINKSMFVKLSGSGTFNALLSARAAFLSDAASLPRSRSVCVSTHAWGWRQRHRRVHPLGSVNVFDVTWDELVTKIIRLWISSEFNGKLASGWCTFFYFQPLFFALKTRNFILPYKVRGFTSCAALHLHLWLSQQLPLDNKKDNKDVCSPSHQLLPRWRQNNRPNGVQSSPLSFVHQ